MKSYYKINNINLKKRLLKIGDKSISHRSIIICSIKEIIIEVYNFLESSDLIISLNLIKQLGFKVYGPINNYICINSLHKKIIKKKINFLGNSGTTTRIILSILTKNNFLIGDISLNKRTMYRIVKPLTLIGYIIQTKKNHFLPIIIFKKKNLGLKYNLINISSQIKSCILLSSFNSFNKIFVIEKKPTRDHSERLIYLAKKKNFLIYSIPNDFSSLCFLILYFVLYNKKRIIKFNFNKLRIGFLEYIIKFGLFYIIINKKIINNEHYVKFFFYKTKLFLKTLYSNNVSNLIDELPLLIVLSQHFNKNKIYGLEELKFKESNRLFLTINNLLNFGCRIKLKKNYIIINKNIIHSSYIISKNDHRMVMCFFYLKSKKKKINNLENIISSFKNFILFNNNKYNNYYVNIK